MVQQIKTTPRTQTVDGEEQVVLGPPHMYHITYVPTHKHTQANVIFFNVLRFLEIVINLLYIFKSIPKSYI